jgi:hypothetical protein
MAIKSLGGHAIAVPPLIRITLIGLFVAPMEWLVSRRWQVSHCARKPFSVYGCR